MKSKCLICGNHLSGKQTKFCSVECKLKCFNNKHQNYKNQQRRGSTRKIKLMQLKGSCCKVCGYNKNYSALAFHHREPEKKSFGLDLRRCSNKSWKSLLAEAEKCDLVCMNCHMEIHHPDLNSASSNNKMNEFIIFNESEVNQHVIKTRNCEFCGEVYKPDNSSRKYCSDKCYRIKSRKVTRPSKSELEQELSKSNFVKVGEKYGVSDNCIRKWLKTSENRPTRNRT